MSDKFNIEFDGVGPIQKDRFLKALKKCEGMVICHKEKMNYLANGEVKESTSIVMSVGGDIAPEWKDKIYSKLEALFMGNSKVTKARANWFIGKLGEIYNELENDMPVEDLCKPKDELIKNEATWQAILQKEDEERELRQMLSKRWAFPQLIIIEEEYQVNYGDTYRTNRYILENGVFSRREMGDFFGAIKKCPSLFAALKWEKRRVTGSMCFAFEIRAASGKLHYCKNRLKCIDPYHPQETECLGHKTTYVISYSEVRHDGHLPVWPERRETDVKTAGKAKELTKPVIRHNTRLDGLEVEFQGGLCTENDVIELKKLGFRLAYKRKHWWARYTPELEQRVTGLFNANNEPVRPVDTNTGDTCKDAVNQEMPAPERVLSVAVKQPGKLTGSLIGVPCHIPLLGAGVPGHHHNG